MQIGLPDQVSEFLNQWLFPTFHDRFAKEESKEVMEKLLECIRDLADEMGPGAIHT